MDICTSILSTCLKLDTFKVEIDHRELIENFNALFYPRLLITTLDGDDVYSAAEGGINYVDFLSSFPRVRLITGDNRNFDSFEGYWPVLEQLPHLTTINLESVDEQDLIAYMGTLTQSKRNGLTWRLSEITELNSYTYLSFSAQAMKFAVEYLTGLDTFMVDGQDFKTGPICTPKHFVTKSYIWLALLKSTAKAGFLTYILQCYPRVSLRL